MELINPYLDLFRELEREKDELRLSVRKKLIWAYSWAVPNREAIEAIAGARSVVEIAAGTGYWAWLIAQAGAEVVAYEREPEQRPQWVSLREGTGAAAACHESSALLLCWPPFQSTCALEALSAFRGHEIFYIGEYRGRTADDAFHDRLESEFEITREITLPCWPGFRDRLYSARRRR